MSEIPDAAEERSWDLFGAERAGRPHAATETVWQYAFARYIADVSEKAKEAEGALGLYLDQTSRIRTDLQSLILPNPEDDLLKEAREICAQDAEAQGDMAEANHYRDGDWDNLKPVRCTLAALKGRK